MDDRTPEPSETPVLRALETVRTAAFVLRDLVFDALDELDQKAVAAWEASLVDARTTLLRLLAQRGCEELETPPRGQLDRYDVGRVKNHVQGISKAVMAEFERIDATPGGPSQLSTSVVYGLVYSLRSIEQFIRWQDPQERVQRLRSRIRGTPRPAPPEPPRRPHEPIVAAAAPVPEPPVPLFRWVPDPDPLPGPEAAQLPEALPPPPPPRPAPPPPRRRDVDLSGFYQRPDEYGGALRAAPLSVFHGCSRGPEFAKRERCLDATCVRTVAGGVAFALADGTESSLGGRVASIIATTTFCEILALAPEGPPDVPAAIRAAVEGARRHLETLLDSLIDSADDSDAIGRLRGKHPVRTVRRILEHTRSPDAGLRNVTPALAVSFTGGLIMRTPRETHEMTVLSTGGSVVERKRRGQSAEALLPGDAPAPRFAPGAAIPWQPASFPLCGPVELKPGDVAVVGSGSLRRGTLGSALDGLALLSPDIEKLTSPQDDHALQILRQAGAAADRYVALDEKRAGARRQRLFEDDLSIVLVTVAARARTATIPVGPIPPPSGDASGARRDALSTLKRLIKKPTAGS